MDLPYQVEIEYETHFVYKSQFAASRGQRPLLAYCVLRPEIQTWLEQNCERFWSFNTNSAPYWGAYTTIHFASESDAVLFKTTWC